MSSLFVRLGVISAISFLIWFGRIEAQGNRGGTAAPVAPREAAPIDNTGHWVSLVTEDWRWRMVTPPKGEYTSVPLNEAGRRAADSWDPARDEAEGDLCKAYGAAAIMRVPGRVRISWMDDTTLRIETDAGTQTRLLHFGPSEPPREPARQGYSVAEWQFAGARGRGAQPRGGGLKVVTTRLLPGCLRKNGVPHSQNATVTEYFNRIDEPNGDSYLIVQTFVEDPQFLTQTFITSTHFRRLPDASGWNPTPCSAR